MGSKEDTQQTIEAQCRVFLWYDVLFFNLHWLQ